MTLRPGTGKGTAGALAIAVVVSASACGGGDSFRRDAGPPPAPTGSVTDVEGNVYPTIVIGKMEWMVENLKTATYNDGTSIPNVTDGNSWANLTSDAYAWYDNDVANKDLYGALYNWYAVDKKKLCPAGWVTPTQDAWGALADSIGGTLVAGGKMKEPGTDHWQTPNTGATNESGFTALPAGERDLTGAFVEQGQIAFWWCSDEPLINLPPSAYFWDVQYQFATASGYESQWPTGYAVRCYRSAPN
jgi:uncharacterized protein (TIGR02145 family)